MASGKGGTGKTTLSVNLAKAFSDPVQLLDCDVEEPNDHLFLSGELLNETIVSVLVPEVDASRCDGCRVCSAFCRYNAIIVPGKTALVFPELCHSCGGCVKVCPQNALKEVEQRIGLIRTWCSGEISLLQGQLDVGVASAPPLIRKLKERIEPDRIVILDAPPGTSCPVVTTLRGADLALLVTEPTPFGLHDLAIAVEKVREIDLPMVVIVNRMGIGDDRVQRFCQAENIPLIAEIMDDRRIAESYSRGLTAIDHVPGFRAVMIELRDKIIALCRKEA